MTKEEKQALVPAKDKTLLTVEEASAYSGLGETKLRELSDDQDCSFVFWNGNKRMFKRRRLDEYLEKMYSV